MVAHFDYYYNKGDSPAGSRGVVLIPRTYCGTNKMNDIDTAAGGYYSSIVNTTVCPSIVTALSSVFGSYLLSKKVLISRTVDDNITSMRGAGSMGSTVDHLWISTQCILPGEIQIYGSKISGSSCYDTGEACNKLAVFNFINPNEFGRYAFWLKDVSRSTHFCAYGDAGYQRDGGASNLYYTRPLIYIG